MELVVKVLVFGFGKLAQSQRSLVHGKVLDGNGRGGENIDNPLVRPIRKRLAHEPRLEIELAGDFGFNVAHAAEAGEFQPVKVNLDVVFGRERHKIRYERVVDS